MSITSTKSMNTNLNENNHQYQATQISFKLTVKHSSYNVENNIEPTELVLPHYSGSWLRGIIGKHLRQLSCMTKTSDCTGCQLIKNCPYGMVFEKGNNHDAPLEKVPTSGFILRPPSWGESIYKIGESFYFSIIVLDALQSYVPYLIVAVQRMAQQGLGQHRMMCDVAFSTDTFSWWNELPNVPLPNVPLPNVPLPNGTISKNILLQLNLKTPTRLQANHQIITTKNTEQEIITELLNASYRRVKLKYPKTQILTKPLISQNMTIHENNLRWRDWERYSSRQKQAMKLGGLTGSITFEISHEDYASWRPFLSAGHLIHIGKNTNFGLGQIDFSVLSAI
jgi:hypothetical protein